MGKDQSNLIRKHVSKYSTDDVKFTKLKQLDWLAKRNNCSIEEMKKEVITLTHLVFAEKQIRQHKEMPQERFLCYFIYSNTRGRCYVLKFNDVLKVITAFPLGRATLTKYKKRFK